MACYHPLRAVLVSGPEGKRLEFKANPAGKTISLPCGRCIGCRLERARQWAVRIMHEAKMHDENSFVTLTYDEENLPKNKSLVVEDCQKFLKRLRARIAPRRFRFFLCGEYGEKLERPHYHAILFGLDFADKVPLKRAGEFTLYSSELLSSAWGLGLASVGAVSFDSAAYVANYATKKVTGPKAAEHYKGRKPEFLTMSRGGRGSGGGIGKSWIQEFKTDVYPSDEVIVRGHPARPPRYYDQVYSELHPENFEKLREKRELHASELEEITLRSGHVVHVAPSRNVWRLQVREKVAKAKAALKTRSLEKS